jgi:hypothetical protein
MPPQYRSRHQFCDGITNANGELYLTERVPYRYRDLPDSRVYEVKQGNTLRMIAAAHFAGIPNASELWWVIADFQPEPIIDPTIALTPGKRLIVPSMRTVQEKIFSENRREETTE